ncbi:MAG: hypothetical protein JW838_00885 [Spirochaetes bacterium]|nr:hypothetical protein [Spirochaetota bacterium]
MKSGLNRRGETIGGFARACRERMSSAPTKIEALESVVEIASPLLDGYRRLVMEYPDEISVSFIELLDQAAFELSENMPDNETVRGYVVDDLYGRLAIYLDCYHDRDAYSSGLNKRILTHEDTVIIRQFRMRKHIPLLMSEFHEQPALQRSILITLVSLEEGDLHHFYYTVARDSDAIDVRALALAGLKKSGMGYRAFHMLEAGAWGNDGMVAYAKSFNSGTLEKNEIPREGPSLAFALRYIESNIELLVDYGTLAWVIAVLRSFIRLENHDLFHPDIRRLICTILVFAGVEQMKRLLSDKEGLLYVRELLDFLPREYFGRIMGKVELWGEEFIGRISGFLAMGTIRSGGDDSNTACYALWKTATKI